MFVEDKNMSVELVKEGLAKMHFTAERGKYFDHLSRFIVEILFFDVSRVILPVFVLWQESTYLNWSGDFHL